VSGVPVLRGVERELLRGHELLLRHRLRHPRQALRRLRLHAPNMRLRRQQQLHPAAAIVIQTSRALHHLNQTYTAFAYEHTSDFFFLPSVLLILFRN
jgi:hypothetical protein